MFKIDYSEEGVVAMITDQEIAENYETYSKDNALAFFGGMLSGERGEYVIFRDEASRCWKLLKVRP